MDYKNIAPTLSEVLTEEEAVSCLPKDKQKEEEKKESPKLAKDAVLFALQYVKYMGVEQIPDQDKDFISMGPSDIVQKAKSEGYIITKEQVKTLCKELRSVKVLKEVKEQEAKDLIEKEAKEKQEKELKALEELNVKELEKKEPDDENLFEPEFIDEKDLN